MAANPLQAVIDVIDELRGQQMACNRAIRQMLIAQPGLQHAVAHALAEFQVTGISTRVTTQALRNGIATACQELLP